MAAIQDARGVPTSATVQASLTGYETALRQFQGYRGDPMASIDAVLATDPEFVMGHVLRAALMVSMWERSLLGEIRVTLRGLDDLAARANERERAWMAALASWAGGDWEGMRLRLDRLLADHPRDALALQLGHLADFCMGDRENLRGRIARALPAWSRDVPGYGFVLGMQAFGLEECGDYGAAEEYGRAALDIETDDGWAHHAVTHVMEMQGRQTEGLAWMESRQSHWAQADNTFAFHNWWHTALFQLDRDNVEAALSIYDRAIRPADSQVQLEMVDATALLWRMHLRRIDVGDRWRSLADAYDGRTSRVSTHSTICTR
ncbi:MAG: tetratricopeptide repeat protein [Rhodospirillales bacterium]